MIYATSMLYPTALRVFAPQTLYFHFDF